MGNAPGRRGGEAVSSACLLESAMHLLHSFPLPRLLYTGRGQRMRFFEIRGEILGDPGHRGLERETGGGGSLPAHGCQIRRVEAFGGGGSRSGRRWRKGPTGRERRRAGKRPGWPHGRVADGTDEDG